MNIVQVVHIRLTERAKYELSKASYDRAEEWLKHWTPVGNFQAVIAESREEALKAATKMLHESLCPSWMRKESGVFPWHFEFEVSHQEVKNSRFWMSTQIVWCHWHQIPKEM